MIEYTLSRDPLRPRLVSRVVEETSDRRHPLARFKAVDPVTRLAEYRNVYRDSHQAPPRGGRPRGDTGDGHGSSVQGQATGGRGQHELSDAEHHGDGAGREGVPGGAGVRPRQHDPFPHPAGHAQERTDVSPQGSREQGDLGRRREVGHAASTDCS